MREHLGFTLRKGKLPNPDKVRNGKVQTPEKVRKGNLPNPAKDKVCPDCGKIVKRLFAAHVQKCKEKLEKMVIQVDSPTAKQDVTAPDGLTVDSDNQGMNKEILVEMDVVTVGGINGTGEMEINNSSKTKAKTSEQKEFQCQNCEKRFSKQDYLRKHMKRLHGENK